MSVTVLRPDFESEPVSTPPNDGRQRALAAALRGLRGAATVEQMLEMIPAELCRCGFTRAWLSTVEADAFRLVGMHATTPQPARHFGELATHCLRPGTHESEMLRRRHAILVSDGLCDDAVEPVISDVFAPRAYVAAPLLVDTRVVAFVHADRAHLAAAVGEDDRELLAVFAEAASFALQRVILAQRLESLRVEVRALTASVQDIVDARCAEPVGLSLTRRDAPCAEALPAASRQSTPALTVSSARLAGLLTARELEVLRLMAGGETNAGIARQLVISEGTVKSHVKSVLRKLHATNRAQAVSRYFRIARSDGPV